MTRHRARQLLAGWFVVLAAVTPAATVAADSGSNTPAPQPPSVIAFDATTAGLQLHVVPGQYKDTFDSAFVESFPYAATAADSSPGATAKAAPMDFAVMDNYPNVACVISVFAPYCDQIQKMPVDTYMARASSDSASTQDGGTAFPCQPGIPEPPTAAIGPPACPQGSFPAPDFGDGAAHADGQPRAHAVARLGPFSMAAPAAAATAYRQRLALAHALLASSGRSTQGVDAASADATVLSIAGVTSSSDFHLDSAGRPVAHAHVVFHDVDALGGMLTAQSITLDAVVSTLGEAHPATMSATVSMGGVALNGQSLGSVDSSTCQGVAGTVNSGGGLPFGLSSSGFALVCGTATSTVDTNPATGYGLDPVHQSVVGPGLDFVQPVNPLTFVPAPMPDICYPQPGLPTPPALPSPPGPFPAPGMPSSTCQFLSTNTFDGNAFSVHFGDIDQGLAAQPALPATDLFVPPPDTGTLLQIPGSPGSPAVPATRRASRPVSTHHPVPVVVARPALATVRLLGVPVTDWLLGMYATWTGGMLVALYLWGAVINRRRRAGLLW